MVANTPLGVLLPGLQRSWNLLIRQLPAVIHLQENGTVSGWYSMQHALSQGWAAVSDEFGKEIATSTALEMMLQWPASLRWRVCAAPTGGMLLKL